MPSAELRVITASWKTPLTEDLWKKLESFQSGIRQEGEPLSLGPTLPDEGEPRIAEAAVQRDSKGNIRWVLIVRPAPKEEPPESIRENDRKIGGRIGLASLLLEGIGAGALAIGSFSLRLSFPEARFSCAAIPRAIERGGDHDAALLLGQRPLLEQVGYRFPDGGAGGIEEVSLVYNHEETRYLATVSATGPLKLSSARWLPYADDVGELVEGAFFSLREARS